jgi:uncharacterized protein (UPF0548 family)
MFDVPGIQFDWPGTAIQPGETVAIVIRHFGFWSLNCCKIVYVIDEEGPVRRFGFAYGTLPEHAEQGEGGFTVEWHRTPDVVSYDILLFPTGQPCRKSRASVSAGFRGVLRGSLWPPWRKR